MSQKASFSFDCTHLLETLFTLALQQAVNYLLDNKDELAIKTENPSPQGNITNAIIEQPQSSIEEDIAQALQPEQGSIEEDLIEKEYIIVNEYNKTAPEPEASSDEDDGILAGLATILWLQSDE